MDLETLRGIAELMKENDITRLKLEEGELELEIEREGAAPAGSATGFASAEPATAALLAALAGLQAHAPAAPCASPATAAAANAGAPTAAPSPAAPALACADGTPCDSSRVHEVCAPMVGVFYVAPAPGAEPFVRVGSKVKKGDTLCILEAMKLMNEVVAERDGEVVEACCEDGELVEYGRVLFRIY